MASWEKFCSDFDAWTKKVSQKVDEVADSAALRLRLSARKGDLEKEYATLGRLTYEKLTRPTVLPEAADTTTQEESETDSLTVQINATLARIGALLDEIELVQQQVNQKAE